MTAQTRFDRHPRVRLLDGPTPIQRLRRVEAALGPGLAYSAGPAATNRAPTCCS